MIEVDSRIKNGEDKKWNSPGRGCWFFPLLPGTSRPGTFFSKERDMLIRAKVVWTDERREMDEDFWTYMQLCDNQFEDEYRDMQVRKQEVTHVLV